MANEVVERELAIANIRSENEGDKAKEIGINEDNSSEDQVMKKCNEEGSVEKIPNFVCTSAKDELNVRNSDLTTEARDTQDDTAQKTLNTVELDESLLEANDDPPDSFFDGLLEDDFLDSLAVVDAWNPDADESCGSDAGEKETNHRTGEGHRSRASESRRKDREESVSKNSINKDGREYSDQRRSGAHSSRNYDRRHARTSVEIKRDSRERSVGRSVPRREKIGIGEYLREVQRRHQRVRDRSRERYAARREGGSRDIDGKSPHRRVKDNRDSTERSIQRRDRKSREKDTEKNIHGGSSSSTSRENKDRSVERSIRKDHKSTVSDRDRSSDRSVKEKKLDLQGLCVDGKDGALQNLKDISKRENIINENRKEEESSDVNVAKKEIKIESVCKEHGVEKEMSPGAPDVTEEETGEQNHMVTKSNNANLNDTKLDTCIKELDDLVPPGTESDFILPTKDETDEFKKENNTRVKEEPEFGILIDKGLSSGDRKSSRHPAIKTESSRKNIYTAGKRNSEDETFDTVKTEKYSLCTASQQPHKEAERVDSSYDRRRRRSGSSRSERGKSSASGSKRNCDHLDEERKRKLQNSSSDEKKRNSTSLEKEFGAARVKGELDEPVRKRRLYESSSGENRSRSRSREKWQYHSDLHRLKRRKDEWNVTSRSRSRSRGRRRELSVGRERVGRSRSRDKQYRKTQSDTRRSRSGSRDKQHESFLERESMGRSRDRDSQYRKTSSTERWQSDLDAQRSKRKNVVQNESRRLERSVSRDKERDSSLSMRILRSRSRDREYRNASSKYRDRQGRPRRSVSQEVARKRLSLKGRRSLSWDKQKRRTPELSSVSAGHMSLSPSISFELSPSPERERRRLSHSVSRERRSRECRRSYRGSSFSPVSSRSTFSRSDSFVSLSLSDESYYRRQPRRKRSPFWKELERKFARDVHTSTYNQSAVYCLPSAVGQTHPEGYNPSSYPVSGTFPFAPVPYPPDPSSFTHGYPPQTGFSDAVVQPPPPDTHIPPSFGSAPPVHLPVPPVMPPTQVPLPVPPPVYNVPPPTLPLKCTDQVAPFSINTEFPSLENVFSQPLHDTEKSEDPPQVPPPPKISQSCDVKKMSLSSLLEASAKGTLSSKDVLPSKDLTEEFKVGGAAKKKQMSVDPLLVVRCEEAVRALEVNDGMILVCPGHLVLQEWPKPHASAATVAEVSLDASAFQSPILRKPDLQLSFTSAPVCDEDSAESSYDYLKLDTKSVQGQFCSEPQGPHAVTPPQAPDSVENFKVYVDSSTMTDVNADYIRVLKKSLNKSQNCPSCLERSKRIMVWNYTQTPPEVRVTDKVMVWNYTQTPHVSFESVGVQAQMVNIGALRKLGNRKMAYRSRRTVKQRGNTKSDAGREKVNKHSAASHSNVSKSAGSGITTALNEDINKEVNESRQQSPRRSHLSTSSNSEGGHRDKDTAYRTASYQIYGKSSFSASSGRSDKEEALSFPVSLSTEPPKGILKTRTKVELQPPPLPSPHMTCQESSQKGCGLPRYSVTPTLQTSKSFSAAGNQREIGNSPGVFGMRHGSSLFGEMDSSGTVQQSVLSVGSMTSGSTAASFPSVGNPAIRVTLSRSQDFYDFHRDRLSPSLR